MTDCFKDFYFLFLKYITHIFWMTYMYPAQTLHENFLSRALDYYRMFFRYVFFAKVTFTQKTHLKHVDGIE